MSYLFFFGRKECAMKSYKMRDNVSSCFNFYGELKYIRKMVPLKLLSANGACFSGFWGIYETWATKRMAALSCDGYLKKGHTNGAIKLLRNFEMHLILIFGWKFIIFYRSMTIGYLFESKKMSNVNKRNQTKRI